MAVVTDIEQGIYGFVERSDRFRFRVLKPDGMQDKLDQTVYVSQAVQGDR